MTWELEALAILMRGGAKSSLTGWGEGGGGLQQIWCLEGLRKVYALGKIPLFSTESHRNLQLSVAHGVINSLSISTRNFKNSN